METCLLAPVTETAANGAGVGRDATVARHQSITQAEESA